MGTPYEQLTVADIMTAAPETARPDDTLADVSAMMEASSIRHLPVVDDAARLLGIVSQRDVLLGTGRFAGTKPVAALMTEDPLTVQPNTRACEASALMLDHKIGALPVVDAAGALVGIITETDFVRIAHDVCGGWALADAD